MAQPQETPVTLSNVAFVARAAIKYGAFLIAFLIVGRILLNLGSSLYRIINPPKSPGPTYGFGVLPPLTFPTTQAEVKSYTLQTKDGSLPVLASQLPVYFMPVAKANLFSSEQAKQVAASLGFGPEYEQVSSTLYRWQRNTPLPSLLEMDIVSQNFTMKTDWASDPNFLSINRSLPTQSSAINDARNVLNDADLLTTDIATGEARVTFLKGAVGTYTPAVSFSEADFLQVDIFRTLILGKYPVFRPDPSKGNTRVIFSGSQDNDQKLIDIEFMHYPVEYDRMETYGLISALEAWKLLQAGKGYVAYLDKGVTNVVVRNVALAYYDSDTPQNYLQPIYVFTGDNNFFGYVPAAASPNQAQSSKR